MIIEQEIVKWYIKNKRDLPWRNSINPYEIWISEVILQQTRVDQALDYYKNFLDAFPDVFALSLASEDEVLKIWQGLGYYSRARNLHFSAKYIVSELNGIFPSNYNDLISLKGIGEYTAAAIASIVYKEKVPVLDGNVYRVLSRLFAVQDDINSSKGKKIFKTLATDLIKSQEADVFNQAIMEFGALQCIPKNPNCIVCPLNEVCQARILDKLKEFPVKKRLENKRNRYFNYFLIDNQNFTYIRKRDNKDIWKGLFELPMIETEDKMDFVSLSYTKEWKMLFGKSEFIINAFPDTFTHQLSHQVIHAVFYRISCSTENSLNLLQDSYLKVSLEQLNEYPVPRLIDIFLNKGIDSNQAKKI